MSEMTGAQSLIRSSGGGRDRDHLRHPGRRHPPGVRPAHGQLDPPHPGPPRAGRRPRRPGVRRRDRSGRRLHGDLRSRRHQPGHADRRRPHGLGARWWPSPVRSAPPRSAPTPSRRPTSAASRCRSPSTTSWSPTRPRSRASVAEAFYIASTGRPGPVLVDVAKSALQATTDYAWPSELRLPGYRPGDAPPLQADPRGDPADPRGAAPGALRRRRRDPRPRQRRAGAARRADRDPGRHHADGPRRVPRQPPAAPRHARHARHRRRGRRAPEERPDHQPRRPLRRPRHRQPRHLRARAPW